MIHEGSDLVGSKLWPSNPTELLSDSLQSESDSDFVGNRRNPTKFMSDLVRLLWDSDEFRLHPSRIPTEENPTTTLSNPIGF